MLQRCRTGISLCFNPRLQLEFLCRISGKRQVFQGCPYNILVQLLVFNRLKLERGGEAKSAPEWLHNLHDLPFSPAYGYLKINTPYNIPTGSHLALCSQQLWCIQLQYQIKPLPVCTKVSIVPESGHSPQILMEGTLQKVPVMHCRTNTYNPRFTERKSQFLLLPQK